MKIKDISKQLPANIPGHRGQLTIMKRNSETYYCLYPETENYTVPVMKGKSIDIVLNKMHKTLIKKEIIFIDKKKKKKKNNKKKSRKPMSKEALRKYKLTRQKNIVKNK